MSLRGLFLHAAGHPRIRRWMSRSPAVRRLAARFVAGETVESALTAATEVNAAGMSASLDYLGESVRQEAEALAARDVYLELLDQIRVRRLNTNVSVKLTQLGLDLSEDFCREQLSAVVARAAESGNFVRVDMEGSAYTTRTLALVRTLRARFNNVGAVIQSYLYRSEEDVRQLLAEKITIRLCKGAYQEPASIACQRKADVDQNYVRLSHLLLSSGLYHGLATHDSGIIAAIQDYARRNRVSPGAFEFQMLYGIRRDTQRRLHGEGWGMRIYIPFGSHWFSYLTRRLAERPANLLFLLRNLFRG